MPSSRRAPVKVVVCQCPCGTEARQRSPCRARPRSRAILVEAPVSSMNTRRSGSRSGCALNQALRRATTSGRSCSAACAVFFEGHPVPVQATPDRARHERGTVIPLQHGGQLGQRNILLRLDCRQDHPGKRLDFTGPRVPALRLGTARTRGAHRMYPANRGRRRHAKPLGRSPARQAARHGSNNTRAQILRKRLTHTCWPPAQPAG